MTSTEVYTAQSSLAGHSFWLACHATQGHVMNNTIKFLAVCAGAPLLALGVGAPAAGADPTTSSGHANVSICHNGVIQVDKGSAFANCRAGSSAVATGAGSTAIAGTGVGSTDNRAVATGGGHAFAGNGFGTSNNTAIATHGSTANAGHFSSNNTAVATGGSNAAAEFGQTVHTH
jgi:hypothetical protein